MIDRGFTTLTDARREGRAIGGFTAYSLEQALAITGAAEETGSPVIIQTGAGSLAAAGGWALARTVLAVAEDSPGRIGVHLDHSRDPEQIRRCLEIGYSSVMYDGSELPFAENVAQTKQVVAMAHEAGAWAEAELGSIPGDEDRSMGAEAATYTRAEDARRFFEETGVDALAVAIGNVHGFAPGSGELSLERLSEIDAACEAPLVLHGASGVERPVLRATIGHGVVKFNVNTELRRAYFESLIGAPAELEASYDLAGLLDRAGAAVRKVVTEFIEVFSSLDDQNLPAVSEA